MSFDRDRAMRQHRALERELGKEVASLGQFEIDGEVHHVLMDRGRWYAMIDEQGRDFDLVTDAIVEGHKQDALNAKKRLERN